MSNSRGAEALQMEKMENGKERRIACREFYMDHDGIPLHAKLEFPAGFSLEEKNPGRCPLVIVQHGFTGHMEEDHILAVSRTLNQTGFATLRTELYGQGKSGGTFTEHTLFKWLSEMLTVIDYAGRLDFVSELFLCGHSQGGLTVMLAGAMKRDQLRAIIPLSPAAMIPEDARHGSMLGHPFDPAHVPDVLEMDGNCRLGGNYLRVARMIWVEPAIDAFTKEVLIIHGDRDETVPIRCAQEAAARYKDAELVVIPGADHCYNGHLEEVTQALAAYMRRFVK